jgi:hypothetical protein
MFISNSHRGYTRDGQQRARGRFLMLVTPAWDSSKDSLSQHKEKYPIRAIVRSVALHQFGQFMMGRVRIGCHEVCLSGAYGGDGLPRDVPMEVYEHAVPVPPDLIEKWNKGGGWNSAGSEAFEMRDWALANIVALTKPLKARLTPKEKQR